MLDYKNNFYRDYSPLSNLDDKWNSFKKKQNKKS